MWVDKPKESNADGVFKLFNFVQFLNNLELLKSCKIVQFPYTLLPASSNVNILCNICQN